MTKRQALISLFALVSFPTGISRAEKPAKLDPKLWESSPNSNFEISPQFSTYQLQVNLDSFNGEFALGVSYKGKEVKFTAEELFVALGGQL